jgi:serine/threonine-protein kinase ATR
MPMRNCRKLIFDFEIFINFLSISSVPETVPFRLTQSMVEAMGILGTEGSFRKCCEVTMSLLQNRKNVLVSYLRPFVFDPLIRNFSQQSEHEPVNHQSLNAINTIKRKLDGYVRKFQKFLEIPLSSEGHVKVIIEEATSDVNLSRMYFFWNPYI